MQKMIIVEDDPMLQDIYKMKFANSGFEVCGAENGKVALEIAKKEKVDVVLTDLVMPEMDGFELAKNLRNGELDPNIKIVVFSNLDKEDNKSNFASARIDGFIAKSKYSPAQLVDEVKKIIA